MNSAVAASEHTLFDRRYHYRAHLPASTYKKFLASYRTAYTTLINIILASYILYGGTAATYVGPLLSAISGGNAYFGQWQNDAWKVAYAAAIGGALGVPIGYAWHYNYIQIIVMFSLLTWVNRLSLWDRLGKIIGALGILLGKNQNHRFSSRFHRPYRFSFTITCHPSITTKFHLFLLLDDQVFLRSTFFSLICYCLLSSPFYWMTYPLLAPSAQFMRTITSTLRH